jgi:hypothetical protein
VLARGHRLKSLCENKQTRPQRLRGWARKSVIVRAWGGGVLRPYEKASGIKPLPQEEAGHTDPTRKGGMCGTRNPRGRLAMAVWPI